MDSASSYIRVGAGIEKRKGNVNLLGACLQGAQLVYKEGAHLTCGVTGFTNADPREPSVSPIEGQRATEGDV